LSGATTVTATGSITFEEDGTLTFSGTGDYPKTPGHFKWLPTRGSTAVASPSSWLHDGAGFIANSASQLRLFHHFGVPGHLTLTDLEVYWEGPEHETWPPENRTYFTLFKLDGTTGGLTQIATVADTNEQGTYEGAHQLTVATGKSVVCATNESLVLWMVTESGTNAEAGSKFLDTKMRCTFEELIGV